MQIVKGILTPVLVMCITITGCGGSDGQQAREKNANQAPSITLIGPSSTSISLAESYSEQGAFGLDPEDGDISADIVIDSRQVIEGKVGSYKVYYNLKDSSDLPAAEVLRTVNVINATPQNSRPTIALTGPANMTLLLGDNYIEQGAIGADREDGDISNEVMINADNLNLSTVGVYQVRYNLFDSMGLAASEVIRTINVVAEQANQTPVISLVGLSAISLSQNTAYQELGATGLDQEDGDISSDIVIDSTALNTDEIGTYIVRYDLQDSQGLKAATVIRSVTVTDSNINVGQGYACNLAVYDYCEDKQLSVSVAPVNLNDGNKTAEFNWGLSSNGAAVKMGRFVNGDYWVAPANGESSVTITSMAGSGNISADADPVLESLGLLNGSRDYGNYSASENIALSLPVSYNRITSIVAVIQRNESESSPCGTGAIEGECADAYQVLTILDAPPADFGKDSLRPPISGTDKAITSMSAFDFSRLPARSELVGATSADFESVRRRWSHHIGIFGLLDENQRFYSEGGRAFRAHILVDDYSAGVAQTYNSALMTMFSDDNLFSEKRSALAAMLTYGLDYYAAMHGEGEPTRYYGSGAGQHLGHFLPAVFASSLLIDSSKATVLSGTSRKISDSANLGPHELDQVNTIGEVPVWGDQKSRGAREYWQNVFDGQCYNGAAGTCSSRFGSKAQRDPYGYIDGSASLPGYSYMGITLGVQRGMVAAMCVMPALSDIINYDPLIEFVDRIDSVGVHTSPDSCAPPDPREGAGCKPYNARGSDPAGWLGQSGCDYYTVTWGPDPQNPKQCIANNISPNSGQTGRFSALHGAVVGRVYTSKQVEDNWLALRGNSSTCRAN
ncbi:immunoglobulin-like domain-containing protein [Agarivorans sp. 1_MG-2023]|uniref:immunoglobulin-like domain-containing protein n=1 Tax=Agarivorans sp. 1_MG-2023 TaxID=3062634 RepID=UPI0026E371DE|nr:immunoglobulin-like domain-containing protein [Agarivorans sp. 1_MG-2023]MDO6764689.1 DUF5011 domain-containing protein [Agarivorans sp. 1_MG-2023]